MAYFGDEGFDSTAKENQRQNNALPAGKYVAVMIDSQKKATKDESGAYLDTQFQVCRGEFQNRRIMHKFNLWLAAVDDKKRMAIQIAKGQLSELCRAVGVLNPKDSSELHGVPVLVKINCKENGEYGMQNNVVKFSALPPESIEGVTMPDVPNEVSDNPWS